MRFRTVLNFRDLGGLKTRDGQRLKKGKIFRSGSLYSFNNMERQAIRDLHLRCILDLRSKSEVEAYPDPVFAGVKMLQHSGVVSTGGEQIDFSPAGMYQIGENAQKQYERLMHYYEQMPFANESFHVLMQAILQRNVPLLFHCATGKDRTGVAAMIVEMALNVKEEEIFQDYMASNQYHQHALAQILQKHAGEIVDHPELERLLRMRAGVIAEAGHRVLQSIKERCGYFDAYIQQEYQWSQAEIEAARHFYCTGD